jgi:succinate-semialdehyde dehydrogenase/glutarate-semialdehyde dehydrogenase
VNLEAFLDGDKHGSFVNGETLLKVGRLSYEYVSPYTQKVWKRVYPVGLAETEMAIGIAQGAYSLWRAVPSPVRARYLRRIAELMLENRELLARVMAMEMGKPVTEGVGEVEYAAGFFSWFAGEAERIYGLSIPSQYSNKSLKYVYEPVGVCGIITPWNFPLAMPARKIAPALAAGCSVVIKPSPETPFSLLLLAQICKMAELPKGVLNVLIGHESEVGEVLLSSPVIRKISFTGSTEVGKYLYRKSADTMKKLTLELGGHAPVLVFDDADLEVAVAETIKAKFRNTGQTCVSANRILVQRGIYERFMARFVDEVRKLKVGDPLDAGTQVSTILNPQSVEKISVQLQDAKDKGAKVVLEGGNPYDPCIISQVTPAMLIFRQETFGPVAPVVCFDTVEEGIALANASEFGLAAYVFTTSMKTANRVVGQLEYGIIGVNDGHPSTPQAPFGGVKMSGIGREGGPTGLYEYMTEKYVSIAF